MNIEDIANRYSTPLYIYDFEKIKNNFLNLKDSFAGRKSLMAYAIKANPNLSILSFLSKLGAGADCVSIGEIKRAQYVKIPNYKIIFSGVGKRDDEIEYALVSEILFINIESEAELFVVEEIAKRVGKKARISIRVNPNIDPKTHPYISTGLNSNKFGVDIEMAKKLYIYAKKSDYLESIGIHFHIGSQLVDLEPIVEASAKIGELLRSLLALEIDIKFFDIGGGLGIRYSDEVVIDPKEYATQIVRTIKGLDVTIVCEPGRSIVGDSGVFATKVLYEKENHQKRFVIVDGAMNDLLRPSLYGAYHKAELLDKDENRYKNSSKADIVGPICESGDFLAKDVELPKTKHNDIIVFNSAGAYGMSMSSNYNSRGRAAEVAFFNGEDWLIRDREDFDWLIGYEKDHIKEVV